uniref:Uncharacterized protein n=1 Tax=Rhizophora mucronata TaxID=61149 RepID=A0A2P2QCJ3_RHIMU
MPLLKQPNTRLPHEGNPPSDLDP